MRAFGGSRQRRYDEADSAKPGLCPLDAGLPVVGAVPLARRDPGGVRSLGGNQFEITVPETTEPAEWSQTTLRQELAALGYEELP